MATAGRTTQGASVRGAENRLYGRQESFTAGDEITEILAWLNIDTGAHNVTAAIYDTSGNQLATGTETSVGTGAAQAALPISYTVAGTTSLVLAVIIQNVAGAGEVYYDATGATSYYDADASTGYPPPATWTGIGTDAGTDNVSIAATYTPAGGGAAPKRMLLLGAG